MSDETGEYEIYIKDRANNNEVKQLTSNGTIWRFTPKWSPDNSKLLFADKNHTLWLLDIASGKQTKIDVAQFDEYGLTQYVWSPNSNDIVYVKNNENRYSSLFHFNIESKKVTRLTDEMTSESNPTFSPDGEYLYFSSERDYNLTFSSYEFDYMFNRATRVYAVAVNNQITPINALSSDEAGIVTEETEDKSKQENSNPLEPQGYKCNSRKLSWLNGCRRWGINAI